MYLDNLSDGNFNHDDKLLYAESNNTNDCIHAENRHTFVDTSSQLSSTTPTVEVFEPVQNKQQKQKWWKVCHVHNDNSDLKWLEDAFRTDIMKKLTLEQRLVLKQLHLFFSQNETNLLFITCPSTFSSVPMESFQAAVSNSWCIQSADNHEKEEKEREQQQQQQQYYHKPLYDVGFDNRNDKKLSDMIHNLDTTQDKKIVILCCDRAWELGHVLVEYGNVSNVICCRLDLSNKKYYSLDENSNDNLDRIDIAIVEFFKVFSQKLMKNLQADTIQNAYDLAVNGAIRKVYRQTGRILSTSKFIKLPAKQVNFNFN